MRKFKGTQREWKMTSTKFNKFRTGSDNVPKVNGDQLRIATIFGEKAWHDKYISNIGRKPEEVRISIVEAKANARLIAAAPELLKVLQNIYNHANLTILQGVLIEEAISKALE